MYFFKTDIVPIILFTEKLKSRYEQKINIHLKNNNCQKLLFRLLLTESLNSHKYFYREGQLLLENYKVFMQLHYFA